LKFWQVATINAVVLLHIQVRATTDSLTNSCRRLDCGFVTGICRRATMVLLALLLSKHMSSDFQILWNAPRISSCTDLCRLDWTYWYVYNCWYYPC
jgi:hypothetical protein